MSSAGGFFLAVLVTLLPAIVLVSIGFSLIDRHPTVATILILGMSVLQLAWVIPLYRYAKRTNNPGMKIGLVLCGSLVFLFCASCGALLAAFSNTNFH